MQNTQIIPRLHAQPLTSAACPWLLFPAEVPAQQPEHTSPIAPAAFPHTSYSQSHPPSFPTQWGTPPPTYCAHNIIKQQSPVLSKAFMCSQHFKRHSTCCMLDAVRLQDWILQCFRKKVRQEESVRGGNRPSFVEFFLRVYAWLYKRAFFFPDLKETILFHTDLFPRAAKLFLHKPVPGWGSDCEGETLSPSTTWKFLDLSCKANQHVCNGPMKKKLKYQSGQRRWGQVCKGEGTACFFQSKILTKKTRDMPGWEEEESRVKPRALRHWLEKQSCKMPGKQVLNHILKPKGRKTGQTGTEGRNKYLF